jgi:trans-aconitate methyltransferase/rubredoxin
MHFAPRKVGTALTSYDSAMSARSCPACGADRAQTVGTITAGQVVAGNSTYHSDALTLLGIESSAPYDFVSCDLCRFVYVRELPAPGFLRLLYEEVIVPERAAFESQSPGWVAHQLRLGALLVERLASAPLVHLLDFGCGYGTLVRAFRGPRIFCKGYEPAHAVVNALVGQGLDITTSMADIEAAAPFDGVILSDVLEHVPEPRLVLESCRSQMKPGGWLAANVPDFAERRARKVFDNLRLGRSTPPDLNPWEHLNYYTPASLARVVESAGFRVDSGATADFGFRGGEQGVRAWINGFRSSLRMVEFIACRRQTTTTVLAQLRG